MLKKFPDAKLTAVEWPGVLGLTRALADQMGLRDRAEFGLAISSTTIWEAATICCWR